MAANRIRKSGLERMADKVFGYDIESPEHNVIWDGIRAAAVPFSILKQEKPAYQKQDNDRAYEIGSRVLVEALKLGTYAAAIAYALHHIPK